MPKGSESHRHRLRSAVINSAPQEDYRYKMTQYLDVTKNRYAIQGKLRRTDSHKGRIVENDAASAVR
jgi:hypothetical protein